MIKKEGAYPKKDIDTKRLQKITDRLQKSDMDYKIFLIDCRSLQKNYKNKL